MTAHVDKPMTPYRIAEVLSAELGILIRPQQLYGAAKGENPRLKFRLSETGTKVVDPVDANTFIDAFLTSRVARAEKRAAKAAETKVESKPAKAAKAAAAK